MKLACVFLLLVFSAAIIAPDTSTAAVFSYNDQEYQQQMRVRLRLAPVTVRDREGRPINGLRAEDFHLSIDGQPAQIKSLEEFDYRVESGSPAAQTLPPRRIILLFDVLSSSIAVPKPAFGQGIGKAPPFAARPAEAHSMYPGPGSEYTPPRQRGIQMSKLAAQKWIEQNMAPHDSVAIIALETPPRLIQTFTSDRESLIRAVREVSLPLPIYQSEALEESMAEFSISEKTIDLDHIFKKMNMSYLQQLGELLAGMPGTKQVILFSSGLDIDKEKPFLSLAREYQEALLALAGAGARVSSVGITGIDFRSVGSVEEGYIKEVADHTGGDYFASRATVEPALRAAMGGMDHYYELSFTPPREMPGAKHELTVSVDAPEAVVRAPWGYRDAASFAGMTIEEKEAELSRDFWHPLKRNELDGAFTFNLLPVSRESAYLHLRARFNAESPDADYRLLLNIGREGELYDIGRWRRHIASSGAQQMDLLLPLPAGEWSFQTAVQDDTSGRAALAMAAKTVPKTAPENMVSPLYLFHAGASTEPEVEFAPRQLTDQPPAKLRALIAAPEARSAAPGERIQAAVIYAGPPFRGLGYQFADGRVIECTVTRTALSEDVEICQVTIVVPDLPRGETTVALYAALEKTVVRWATAKLVVQAKGGAN